MDLSHLTLTEVSLLVSLMVAAVGALVGWMKGRQDGKRLAIDSLTAALDRANGEIDRLSMRMVVLEERSLDAAKLLRHLESVYSWIERGAKPPPPRRPDWLEPGEFSPLAE